MTSDRDFDRLARAWLELGPNEAPDRVVAAVLQAAETTPQVRRPFRWLIGRSFPMNRLTMAAVVATVIAIVVGGGLLLTQRNQPPVGSTPSPSITDLPSASPGLVPAELRSYWTGPPRSITTMTETDRFRFVLNSGQLAFPDDDLQNPQLGSTVTALSADTLEMVTTDSTAGCNRGDRGRYTWSLSPGGVRLTLVAASDACRTREAALTGEWFRVACTNEGNGCLGELEAGTFASQYFSHTSENEAPDGWHPIWGQLTYTVPAGWANSTDWPNMLTLTPSAEYEGYDPSGRPKRSGVVLENKAISTFHGIGLWTMPEVLPADDACGGFGGPDAGTGDSPMSGIVNAPALTATPPQTITIDGQAGQWTDVAVKPSWNQRCGETTIPALHVLSNSTIDDTWNLGLAGEARQRLILLELDEGNVVLIAIAASDPARFDELVAEAMPIVESFDFK